MTVANNLIVPKNRLVGAKGKVHMHLIDTKNASGPSGANRLVGCAGVAQFPLKLQHLEYQYDNEVSGEPTLYIGIRRNGVAEVADVIDDPAGEFSVLLAEEVLADGTSDILTAVDLNSFTDEQLTMVEGDELIAVMGGPDGPWTCVYPRVLAVGIEQTPTNSI